jgi:hypothetical protein
MVRKKSALELTKARSEEKRKHVQQMSQKEKKK